MAPNTLLRKWATRSRSLASVSVRLRRKRCASCAIRHAREVYARLLKEVCRNLQRQVAKIEMAELAPSVQCVFAIRRRAVRRGSLINLQACSLIFFALQSPYPRQRF